MATKAKTTTANEAKPKTTAVANVKANLPANIEAEMAAAIANLSKRLSAPSGDRITVTQQGKIKLPNGMEVDEIEGVIIDFVSANYYYEGLFDRNNIVPPNCFAIGLEPAGLVPSANSPDKQCESCAGCWANQFKSARNKKGKACQNTRLMAIIPLDADENTPFWIVKASATAIKSFDGHVGNVMQKYGVPICGVSTKITLSDEEYPSLRFEVIEKLSTKAPLFATAWGMRASAMERLQVEPDLSAAANEGAKPAARRAMPAKKAVGARR